MHATFHNAKKLGDLFKLLLNSGSCFVLRYDVNCFAALPGPLIIATHLMLADSWGSSGSGDAVLEDGLGDDLLCQGTTEHVSLACVQGVRRCSLL